MSEVKSMLVAGQGIMISHDPGFITRWQSGPPPPAHSGEIRQEIVSLEPYAASAIAILLAGEPGQILMKTTDGEIGWVDPLDIIFLGSPEEQSLLEEQDGVKEIHSQLMDKLREYKMLVKLYKEARNEKTN